MNMTLREYSKCLECLEHQPACLRLLTEPFGLQWSPTTDSEVMIGHILDGLAEEFKPGDYIDSLDVATLAWELGSKEAGRFLEEAPKMLYEQMNPLHVLTDLN